MLACRMLFAYYKLKYFIIGFSALSNLLLKISEMLCSILLIFIWLLLLKGIFYRLMASSRLLSNHAEELFHFYVVFSKSLLYSNLHLAQASNIVSFCKHAMNKHFIFSGEQFNFFLMYLSIFKVQKQNFWPSKL